MASRIIPPITQARLKELLHYNPETGVFTWILARKKVRVGGRAGTLRDVGDGLLRWTIGIDYKRYLASRLAWFYMTGEWPTKLIDHKDGDSTNDSFCNLRNASSSQNMQNQRRPSSRNKAGFLGVSPFRNKWKAVITLDGIGHHLGCFDSPEEASHAYVEAKRRLHEFGGL